MPSSRKIKKLLVANRSEIVLSFYSLSQQTGKFELLRFMRFIRGMGFFVRKSKFY